MADDTARYLSAMVGLTPSLLITADNALKQFEILAGGGIGEAEDIRALLGIVACAGEYPAFRQASGYLGTGLWIHDQCGAVRSVANDVTRMPECACGAAPVDGDWSRLFVGQDDAIPADVTG